ncbi:MAG: putative drug exporter of the superfamily [Frankiales bacterium]|jgi:RND superfamily putative drug exporter|nr:putative drug exporter of the superfamily [Frankiales bacterium]
MDRLSSFVLTHRRKIFGFWFVVFVAGIFASGAVSKRLSYDFSLPGQSGYETEQKLIKAYGGANAQTAYVPVVTVPSGQTVAGSAADIKAVFDSLRAIPSLRVVDYSLSQDKGLVTSDGRTTFGLVYEPQPNGFVDPLKSKVEAAFNSAVAAHHLTGSITGYAQLAAGDSSSDNGPSILTETLLGAVGALGVLAFVFASLLALVPMLIAAVSILTTFLIVLLLTTFTDVSFVVQFLIALVGLGVAIDYSLLVVSRWREEIAHGASNEEAVRISVRHAGHAVFASGVTVAISLVALVVVPVPLLRSMGFGGMLIPLCSVAVVLTLLPAMLASVGRRVDIPHIRKEGVASRGWTAWAKAIVRKPWLVGGAALIMLGFAIAPLTGIQFGQSSTKSQGTTSAAYKTLLSLEQGGIGSGALTPIVVLSKGTAEQTKAIADASATIPGIRAAVINPPGTNGYTAIDVVPDKETVNSSSVAIVDRLAKNAKALPGYVGVAGLGPTIVDYRHAVYDNFPYVIGLIAIITFILLVRTFRSILLPLKAVVLNLISLAAVLGVSTYFWQDGHGSNAVFGIAATGAMTFWLPPLIFAFLFGLSMDYEVFILARMREEYDRSGSTQAAVVRGLGRTGRLVTSAALILFFAFAALASAPGTDIKVFATALGVGILLDATIVRALLVPSLVVLFGRWNWWLPVSVAKVLRVEPSPLHAHGEPLLDQVDLHEESVNA